MVTLGRTPMCHQDPPHAIALHWDPCVTLGPPVLLGPPGDTGMDPHVPLGPPCAIGTPL